MDEDEGAFSAAEALIEGLVGSGRSFLAKNEPDQEIRSGGAIFTMFDTETGEEYEVVVSRVEN